jgi:hypothetical protein
MKIIVAFTILQSHLKWVIIKETIHISYCKFQIQNGASVWSDLDIGYSNNKNINIYEYTNTKLKFQHILMVKNTCCTYAQMFNLSSNIIFQPWNQFLSVTTNNQSRPKMKWHLATAAHFKPLTFIKYWYTTISAIAASVMSHLHTQTNVWWMLWH